MAQTMQQLCDRARIPLQDNAKVRYGDTDLLAYGNAGIHLLVQKRPDLFFGSYATPPVDLALGGTLPLADGFF
jgi:hypothetical protein